MEMILLLWLPLAIAAAMFAHMRRNRNAFGWFVFALLLSPFFAFLFLAILREKATPVRVTPSASFMDDLLGRKPSKIEQGVSHHDQ